MNYLCVYYFFTEKFVIPEFSFRHSFIYCLPYFLGGVLIYLYRDKLRSLVSSHRILSFAAMLICIIAYYIIPDEIGEISLFTPKNLLVSTVILIYAIGAEGKLSNNKAVAYLSAISMEMYLCQMILFRGAEKLHLLYIAGDGWVSFILCNIIVIAMIIIFCAGFRFGWDWLEKRSCQTEQRNNNMKCFVTGVGGQLGFDVMNELAKRGYEGVGSDILPSVDTEYPYVQLDITDAEAVEKAISDVKPDVVVHCAAWTAVDAAEDEENQPKGKGHQR